jgi:rhamnose transport system ATP-binding protein
VLGGFEVSGGKGGGLGLLISLLLLGTLQNGMGLANVPGPVQSLVFGVVLLFAVCAPAAIEAIRDAAALGRLRNAQSEALEEAAPLAGGESPLLDLRGVAKSFGGIRALDGMDLSIRPGSIHALVGENGAGKSTLIRVVTGILRPDSGECRWDGKATKFKDPMAARSAGIVAVYQDPDHFPTLTVAESVFLGIEPRTWLGTIDRRAMRDRTCALLRELGVDLDPMAGTGGLSVGQLQYVELARALAGGSPRLFILDEPTASLS